MQIYCDFLTCATLSAHFFAEFFSGLLQNSCNLQPAQAVSAVGLFFIARMAERTTAATATATMMPASTYWTVAPMIEITYFGVLNFFFTRLDNLAGVKSAG